MRPPKPLPANVVLKSALPFAEIASDRGVSPEKFDAKFTFVSSRRDARSTTEMFVPPVFAT